MRGIADAFRQNPSWTLDALATKTKASVPAVSAGLNKLAVLGQVIHDLAHGVYRWRQVMPVTLSAEVIGPENEETVAARHLVGRRVQITHDATDEKGKRHVRGLVKNVPARQRQVLADQCRQFAEGLRSLAEILALSAAEQRKPAAPRKPRKSDSLFDGF